MFGELEFFRQKEFGFFNFRDLASANAQLFEAQAIAGDSGLNRRMALRDYYTLSKKLGKTLPTLIDCIREVQQAAFLHQPLFILMIRWATGADKFATDTLAYTTKQGNDALVILNQYTLNTGLDPYSFPGDWHGARVFSGGAIGTSSLWLRHDGVNKVQDVSLPDGERHGTKSLLMIRTAGGA